MIRFELLRQVEKDPFILKCHKCESKPLEILFMQTSLDHRICLCEKCYKEIGEIFNFFRKAKT